MALYFASVEVNPGQNLHDALNTHYSSLPQTLTPPVQVLLPPMPNMVNWINMAGSSSIMGTISKAPYTAALAFTLPIELGGMTMRNTIDLAGIFFNNTAQVAIDLIFSIV